MGNLAAISSNSTCIKQMNLLKIFSAAVILPIRYYKIQWRDVLCALIFIFCMTVCWLKFRAEEYRNQPSQEEIEFFNNGGF